MLVRAYRKVARGRQLESGTIESRRHNQAVGVSATAAGAARGQGSPTSPALRERVGAGALYDGQVVEPTLLLRRSGRARRVAPPRTSTEHGCGVRSIEAAADAKSMSDGS